MRTSRSLPAVVLLGAGALAAWFLAGQGRLGTALAEGGASAGSSPASAQDAQESPCVDAETVGPPNYTDCKACADPPPPDSPGGTPTGGGDPPPPDTSGGTPTPPDGGGGGGGGGGGDPPPQDTSGGTPTPPDDLPPGGGSVSPHDGELVCALPLGSDYSGPGMPDMSDTPPGPGRGGPKPPKPAPGGPSDFFCAMPGPAGGGGGGIKEASPPMLTFSSHIGMNRMSGNWWFPWDIYVVPQTNGDLILYQQGRAGDTYTWDAISSSFVSPPGFFDQMVANTNGTWTRTTKHGVVWQFNTAGHIVSETNRWGLATTITRNGSNQIQSVMDYAGRTTTLAYHSNGYLASLTDSASRVTSFTYTTQGYLSTITYPSTTFWDRVTSAMVTRGKTISLAHSTGTGTANLDGNLTGITDDAGGTLWSVTYDSSDRVTAHSHRGNGWTFSYGSTTTVVDPDGVTTTYSFNSNGAITRKEVFTRTGLGLSALRTGEPNSYVWQYTRGGACSCDLVTQITRPDGSTAAFTYDSLGNGLSRTETPPSGSSAPTRVTTWTFSNFAAFSLPLTRVTPGGNASGATAADFTTTWSYDSSGNLTTLTFPKATVSGSLTHPSMTASYNSAGRPLTIVYPNGTVYKMQYATTTFDLVKVTQDFGASPCLNLETEYGYDSLSRCTSIEDARGNTWTLTYNDLDQLTNAQGPGALAGETKIVYDNLNMVRSFEFENLDASGTQVSANPWFTTTRSYDSSNRLASEVVEVDASTTATTSYLYTAAGRLWKITDAEGDIVEQLYDERGLLYKYSDGVGTALAGTTKLNYDVNGNLASTVDCRGNATTYQFNHEGWLKSTTDAASASVHHTYDIEGRHTQAEYRNSGGTAIARYAMTWDPFGLRLSTGRQILNSSGTTTSTFTTSYEYDANLQLAEVTDPLSNVTIWTRDALGRTLEVEAPSGDKQSFVYDECGNVVEATVEAWNQATSAAETLVFEHTYDALHRRTQTLRRDSGSTTSTTESWTHDSRGNVLDATDAMGNTTHFAYDARGLLLTTTRDLRANGVGSGSITSTVVTQAAYDLVGRVVSRTDGLSNATAYAYDSRGRLVTETDPATGTRTFTHDANGNVLTVTDPLGSVQSNTFDARNLLTARAVTRATGVLGTSAEAYTYDAMGRLTQATDDDSTVQYTYDSLGRVLTETQGPNPISTSGKTFTYAYNSVDAVTGITYPDGTVETRSRDAVQRISSLSITSGPTVASWQYAGGRMVAQALQGGVTRTSTFDALWRETMVEYTNSSGSLRKFEYEFNNADYRLLEKRHHASGTGDNYKLDSLYRTTFVKEGVADPVAERATPGSQTYARTKASTYDAAQNRTQVVETPSGGSAATTSYKADALNFYTAVGSTSMSRDANGNLRDDGTMLYDFDYRDRLCRVRDKASGATISTYSYDTTYRRIGKVVGSTTWAYYWTFEAMAMEYDGSGLFSRQHFGGRIDEIAGAYQRDLSDLDGDSSTTDFVWITPVYDGALDCAAVIGPGSTVAESYIHAFDGVVSILSASGTPLSTSALGWSQGYAGMRRDVESGLLYSRQRSYSPDLGRWLTEDWTGPWHDVSSLGNSRCWVGSAYRNALDPFGAERVKVNMVGPQVKDAVVDAAHKSSPFHTYSGDSLLSIVNDVLLGLKDCDCIDTVRIIAHGRYIDPVTGEASADAYFRVGGRERISADSLSKNAHERIALRALGARLCAGADVILETCNVLADGSGRRLVGAIAGLLGDRVGSVTAYGGAADGDGWGEKPETFTRPPPPQTPMDVR